MILPQWQSTEAIYEAELRLNLKGDTKDHLKLDETIQLPPANNYENSQAIQKKGRYKCFLGEFETKIYWGNLIGILVLHLLTLHALITFNYIKDFWLFCYVLLIGEIGAFGITAGAHRYWTHKCFKATLPLKVILLFCYSVAGQNTLLEWVKDHRVHHKFSETEADPHNSNRGFLFAHVGWLCMKKHPEVIRKGKMIDVSDICGDPLVAFHIRHWAWFKLIFCFILPIIIPPVFFAQPWLLTTHINIARYCLSLNFTWAVNSFAHFYGNKPYNKHIQPTENKLVSWVSFGEGWHNYHHSFPWDYRAAEIGRRPNFTTFWLDLFAKLGWAYELKTTSSEIIDNMVKDKGDGSHILSQY
ncbi:acyl-CoA Delta(11) desaturase-like [Euwallacea fornicatus]|uniref:acyl-CoA Delta(11) desaturase-like n=1 Tax=Euwallacea fornicatus TaxID=995702 RepID=UPI00338EA560